MVVHPVDSNALMESKEGFHMEVSDSKDEIRSSLKAHLVPGHRLKARYALEVSSELVRKFTPPHTPSLRRLSRSVAIR